MPESRESRPHHAAVLAVANAMGVVHQELTLGAVRRSDGSVVVALNAAQASELHAHAGGASSSLLLLEDSRPRQAVSMTGVLRLASMTAEARAQLLERIFPDPQTRPAGAVCAVFEVSAQA